MPSAPQGMLNFTSYDAWRRAPFPGPARERITLQTSLRRCPDRWLGVHYGKLLPGVNDVLSLKQANLAIAMESGSKATRNVADLVLLKDSFGTLPYTFLEGQRLRNGIQDVMKLFMVRVFHFSAAEQA